MLKPKVSVILMELPNLLLTFDDPSQIKVLNEYKGLQV